MRIDWHASLDDWWGTAGHYRVKGTPIYSAGLRHRTKILQHICFSVTTMRGIVLMMSLQPLNPRPHTRERNHDKSRSMQQSPLLAVSVAMNSLHMHVQGFCDNHTRLHAYMKYGYHSFCEDRQDAGRQCSGILMYTQVYSVYSESSMVYAVLR